ncbi:MAG: ABC transporter substrate-binding protein [Gemmatimonadetes bacterium]|nr:ABC transporter substrate-binding protein [Gemmatimonadota bacterium]
MTGGGIARRSARLTSIHLAALCLLPLLVGAAACGTGEDSPQARGSSVTVAYCCGREALSPYTDMSARYLVFLPLVESDGSGERVPRLARSWSHSADYREWTYHLRTDVQWDDGIRVTAHDVKFSLDLLAHPEVAYLSDRPGESVTVHDDSTLTIRKDGWFIDGNDWWLVYWPKHVLEGLDPAEFYEWDFWTRPVGNGPYRFIRYVPETMMEFEVNPDYYGRRPRIERVVLKFSGAAGLAELLAEGVDAITENDPADIHALVKDPRFRVYHGVAETVALAVVWNGAYPPFQDLRVRRALTLAIDRRGLLRALDLPDYLPIADAPYTARQFLRGELLEPLPYDPEAAAALLEEAGWRELDGDGVREKDGRALRFTAIAVADAALEPGGLGLATHVQGQLRRVGVRMEIRPLEPGLVFDRLRSGDFEAAFTVFQHLAGWLERFLGAGSRLGYENPAVTSLIDRAVATADPDTMDAIHRDLAEIFRRDLPVTFLFPRTESYFVHRRIRGLEGRYWPDPVLHMEELWLEDGE